MLDFSTGNVYIDFPFERVMFYWTPAVIMRKFYGANKTAIVGSDSELFRDAQRHGTSITKAVFDAGRMI